MPAIINSPAHTELTLMDVRTAHEIAEAIATEMEEPSLDEVAEWPDRIASLLDLLRGCLARHRVYPFFGPEGGTIDASNCGLVPVPEAQRHSQVVQAIALLVKQQAAMQTDEKAWALYVDDCCTYENLCDEIEQYGLMSFDAAVEFYVEEAAKYFDVEADAA